MGGVSPIDMQVMITKSVEVAKQYGQDIHKGVTNQQNKADDEKRLQEENTKKVHDRDTVERVYATDPDEEKKKGNVREELDKKEETEEESEENIKEEKKNYEGVMGHFDMKI